MKAIDVSVYSNEQFRCSNGGISEKYDELLLLHERGNLDIEGDEENLCKVVHRVINGLDIYHIQPVAIPEKWYMFGGSFAYSCDARFAELVGGQYGAIAIHDRVEY